MGFILKTKRHLILFALLLAGFAAAIYFSQQESRFQKVSKPLPLLPLDIKSIDGKWIDGNSLLGKPVLLHFWAYWCYPCLTELPSLQKLSETYPDLRVVLVHVKFTGEGVAAVTKLWQEKQLSLENYYDENVDVSKKFGVENLPSTLVFNKNHSLIYRVDGELDWSTEEAHTSLENL